MIKAFEVYKVSSVSGLIRWQGVKDYGAEYF